MRVIAPLLPVLAAGALTTAHTKAVEEAISANGSFHSVQSVINEKMMHMSSEEAWNRIKSKNHPKVAMFQGMSHTQTVDEDTINKARAIMNKELVAAYEKLDAVMARCSNEWQMYTSAFNTAVVDLLNIQEAVQDATSTKGIANQEQADFETAESKAKFDLEEERHRWDHESEERTGEINAQKLEMAVKIFVLSITGSQVEENPLENANAGLNPSEESEPSLIQKRKNRLLLMKKPKVKSLVSSGMEVCYSANGQTEYKFADPKIQRRLDELQEKANRAMAKVQREAMSELSFLQIRSHYAQEPGVVPAAGDNSTANATDSSSMAVSPAPAGADPEPVEEGDPFAERKRCDKVPQARYGMLHDRMAQMFGLTADTINILEKEYNENEALHLKKVDELTKQQNMYADLHQGAMIRHGRAMAALTELAVAKTSTEDYKTEIEHDRETAKGVCMKRIDTIMVDEVCGVKAVRDQIQSKSSVHPATEIEDCKFDNGWEESPCTNENGVPINCSEGEQKGGTRTLTRAIMDAPNEFGAQCPRMKLENIPCGINPCPKECITDPDDKHWGRCTALCDGGEETATLRIKQWPAFGGAKCAGLTETRPCNQEACNQDCKLGAKLDGRVKLHEWSEWSHCSRACYTQAQGEKSAGFQERRRDVLVKAKGDGTCPLKYDPMRRETEPCNDQEGQECQGDEVCQAYMDLVFLIDSSGSVGRDNFRKMLMLVQETVKRFEAEPFEQPGVNVAAIKFGNGFIENSNGAEYTISPAKVMQNWTTDYESFGTTLQGARHARGFTNLAQGYSRAEDMFLLPDGTAGSRTGAKITKVLVLTDGTVPFQKEAEDAFERLDNGGYRVNAVIFNDNPEVVHKWHSLVTQPANSSIVTRSSFKAIETPAGRKTLITDIISGFCPKSESPSKRQEKEVIRGFQLIRQDFDCPSWIVSLNQRYTNTGGVSCINGSVYDRYMCRWKSADWLERAKVAAEEYGADAFVCGVSGWYEGHCFVEDKDATDQDSCPISEMPWADPNATDGYVSTNGWAGGEFNVYQIVESVVTQTGSTAEP